MQRLSILLGMALSMLAGYAMFEANGFLARKAAAQGEDVPRFGLVAGRILSQKCALHY